MSGSFPLLTFALTLFYACAFKLWFRYFLSREVNVKGKVLVTQSCPTLCDPMDWMKPVRLFCPWDFPGKNTGVGCHFLLQGHLPDPGTEPASPALQADSLLSEPSGKLPCLGRLFLNSIQAYSPSFSLSLLILFSFLFFFWSTVDLQPHVSFTYTA